MNLIFNGVEIGNVINFNFLFSINHLYHELFQTSF